MSNPLEPAVGEIRREAATTRRVLERIPDDKLGWKPHAKSMTLGQLGMHVATIPGAFAGIALADNFQVDPARLVPPEAKSTADILNALDSGVKAAEDYLGTVTESTAAATWSATLNGRQMMSMPRAVMLRTLMLNHWYHHRGQLSVYLRLLDVPVPSIYGPSADDNPFV